MSGFGYLRPADLGSALGLLGEHGDDAHLLAGGTSFMLLYRQGLIEPGVVIDLAGIDALRGIRQLDDGTLGIGALCSLRTVETDPLVAAIAPDLARTVARVATIRIRDQATIGGNLAHADPAQDPPPMLLALDASVVLRGPGGERTVPLAEFFVDVFETVVQPGEILTEIRVPVPSPASRFGYRKFLPRTADDYATVCVAGRLDVAADGTVADARIALGGVGPTPIRASEVEAALRGARLADLDPAEQAAGVAEAIDPVDDVRGSADYKRDMAVLWTSRLLRSLAGGATA